MDQESVALASTAAATLATLLATDAWALAKQELAGLWRRFKPSHASVVEEDLDAARVEALEARETGDESVTRSLTAEWEPRLRRLLAVDPAAFAELDRVVAKLTRAVGSPAGNGNVTVTQQADASGHGSVIQVARDAAFGDRPDR